MKLRSIRQLKNLKGKRLLVRVDFNVAVTRGKIPQSEWQKMRATLETIEWLRKRGAVTVLLTHLGQPNGKRISALSTKSLVQPLSRLLKQPVFFASEAIGPKAMQAVERAKPGTVFLLENIRFYAGEEKNSTVFARQLARLGDYYVNDAFAVSHRRHASVAAVSKYLRSHAGLLLEREVAELARLLHPKHPFVVIMGGAKITTKIPVIHKLLACADAILLGGALANTVFASRGISVGNSLVERSSFSVGRRALQSKKIKLPIDVRVLDGRGRVAIRAIGEVRSADRIMDVGPRTTKQFAIEIHRGQTIVWNGPLGVCEDRRFSLGTRAIAGAVIARSSGRAFGVVGGGDTIPFVRALPGSNAIDFISTGGGAMLEYLSGKMLPGLKPLILSR